MALSFPPFDYDIISKNRKRYIFDIIRKKYVVLTPEEWVRQHVVHYLIHTLSYTKSLIKIEGAIASQKKRVDIVLYNRMGNPQLLIECKASTVLINDKILTQVAHYRRILKVEMVLVTNGKQHICFQVDHQQGTYHILNTVPHFLDIIPDK